MSNRNRQPVGAAAAVDLTAASADAAAADVQAQDNNALAAAADDQPQADIATDNNEPVEGRVLVAFDDYAPNDIFVGSAEEALEAGQKIDCHPKAVAYAKSLKG